MEDKEKKKLSLKGEIIFVLYAKVSSRILAGFLDQQGVIVEGHLKFKISIFKIMFNSNLVRFQYAIFRILDHFDHPFGITILDLNLNHAFLGKQVQFKNIYYFLKFKILIYDFSILQ